MRQEDVESLALTMMAEEGKFAAILNKLVNDLLTKTNASPSEIAETCVHEGLRVMSIITGHKLQQDREAGLELYEAAIVDLHSRPAEAFKQHLRQVCEAAELDFPGEGDSHNEKTAKEIKEEFGL